MSNKPIYIDASEVLSLYVQQPNAKFSRSTSYRTTINQNGDQLESLANGASSIIETLALSHTNWDLEQMDSFPQPSIQRKTLVQSHNQNTTKSTNRQKRTLVLDKQATAQFTRQTSQAVKKKLSRRKQTETRRHSLPFDFVFTSITTNSHHSARVSVLSNKKKRKQSIDLVTVDTFRPEKAVSIIKYPELAQGVVGLRRHRKPVNSINTSKQVVDTFKTVIQDTFTEVRQSPNRSAVVEEHLFSFDEDAEKSTNKGQPKFDVVANCLDLLSRHLAEPDSLQKEEFNSRMLDYVNYMRNRSRASSCLLGEDTCTDTSSTATSDLSLTDSVAVSPRDASPGMHIHFSRPRSRTHASVPLQDLHLHPSSVSPYHSVRRRNNLAMEHRLSQAELENEGMTSQLNKKMRDKVKLCKMQGEAVNIVTAHLHAKCSNYAEFEHEMDTILYDKKRHHSWREVSLLFWITRKLIRLEIHRQEHLHEFSTINHLPEEDYLSNCHIWPCTIFASSSSSQSSNNDSYDGRSTLGDLVEDNPRAKQWQTFCLRYFQIHLAEWIEKQGGFEAILDIGNDWEVD